jgi:ATP-binding cassette subfamily F protein uup
VETHEVLGDRPDEYKGTLIVVSHDRMFMDSVVTSVFAFEPCGHIERRVRGYTDWLRQGRPPAGNGRAEGPRLKAQKKAPCQRQGA